MRSPWIQRILSIVMAVMLLRWLAQVLGWQWVAVIVVVAATTAVCIWMLRHRRRQLRRINTWPVAREYIAMVARISNLQPPEKRRATDEPDENLLLVTPDEFTAARRELRSLVLGHDAAIRRIIEHLQKRILLSEKRDEAEPAPPLATLLLCGPAGIGKSYLGTVLGQLVFRPGLTLELNMQDYSEDSTAVDMLFGSDTRDGDLISAVRSNPWHTIILNDVEFAAPRVQQFLRLMLSNHQGDIYDPFSRSTVSFRNCVLLLCTAAQSEELSDLIDQQPDVVRSRVLDRLGADTPLEPKFLSQVEDVVLMQRPEPMVAAEIVHMLMQQECQRYEQSLRHVDPHVLADLTRQATSDDGFELIPARVETLLREELAEAVRTGRQGITVGAASQQPLAAGRPTGHEQQTARRRESFAGEPQITNS